MIFIALTYQGVPMKLFVILIISAVSQLAVAADVVCGITETIQQKTTQTVVNLLKSEDPHGSMESFKLSQHSEFSGFVALSKGFTVINLVNNETGIATSTLSESQGKFYARLQILHNISEAGEDSIAIECRQSETK